MLAARTQNVFKRSAVFVIATSNGALFQEVFKDRTGSQGTGALTGTIGILQGNGLAAKDVAVSTFSPFEIYSALWVWMII
jgi:hypothetical protein